MDYEFTHPAFLRLLYVAPVFWLIAVLGIGKLAAWRLVLSALLRSIVFAVVVLMLAGIGAVEKSPVALKVVFLVDISDSMDDKSRGWIDEYIQGMDSGLSEDTVREVSLFGLNSTPVFDSGLLNSGVPPHPDISQPRPSAIETAIWEADIAGVNAGKTNIEGALVAALGRFPEKYAKRIVLITDGNENVGDAVRGATLAMSEGVKVFTVSPPKSSFKDTVSLKKVVMPGEIRVGKTAEIKIVVENSSGSAVTGSVDVVLRRGGGMSKPELFKQWRERLLPGLNLFRVKYRPEESGFVRFESMLDVNDSGIKVESGSIVSPVVITGKSRILYVNGIGGREPFLPGTLRERDMEVDVVAPDKIPETIPEMLMYESVIFSNVAKAALKPGQMEVIEQYVRDFGGGFVMLGGENSFIQGGYGDTPIERILPVKMEGGEHKRQEKRYRFSLMLVIDKSASMGGKKMTFAKKAALELVHQLKAKDKLGIVAFDNSPYMITDLRPIPAVEVDIVSKLSRLHPGGGTSIFPALKMAYLNIVNSGAKKNHVILLSDGNTEYQYYNKEALIQSFANAKISISTIAIGKWFVNTNLLKEIANRTKGSFYRIDDVAQLPRLIMKDVEDSISQTDIHEEYFFPIKIADSQILKEISQQQLPPLRGYSITTLKDGAEMSMATDIRGKVDPVLANWRYGLGKTLVYTADAEARWSSDWIKWMKYNKFWSQALRWSVNDNPESDYSLRVEMINEEPHLVLQSDFKEELFGIAGKAGDDASLELRAMLYRPVSGGASQTPDGVGMDKDSFGLSQTPDTARYNELHLRQIGPESYIAPLGGVLDGNYFVNVLFVKGGETIGNKAKGLVIPPLKVEEFTVDTGKMYNDAAKLKRIAAVTGGGYEPDVADVAENPGEIVKLNDLARYLIPVALAALLADIALRRWNL